MKSNVKKKLLLIKPPEQSKFNFGTFSLGVLAASVRDVVDVSLLDATEMSITSAVNIAINLEPNVIGVTVMGLKSINPVAAFIEGLRSAIDTNCNFPERIIIIVGGHGASMAPEFILKSGADVVAIGEGEITLKDILIEGIHSAIPGIAHLENNYLRVGPGRELVFPLDCLPSPARDLMPPPPDGIHLMESSRGCPHACTFCEATLFYGKRWRPFSPTRVASEVKYMIKEHNAWIIHFADDNFAASATRVRHICDELLLGPLPAFFMVSARADDLLAEPDLIKRMANSRILRISVGVETLEPEIGYRIDKEIPFEIYKHAFQLMRDNNIFSVASFIIGLPGEDQDSRNRVVEKALELGPDSAQFLPYLPLPGTPLSPSTSRIDSPDPNDVREAIVSTRSYMQHSSVQSRLEFAISQGGIRGILAQGTLEKSLRI